MPILKNYMIITIYLNFIFAQWDEVDAEVNNIWLSTFIIFLFFFNSLNYF